MTRLLSGTVVPSVKVVEEVIIVISNSVKFECNEIISDKEGRFIIVKGKLENEVMTLVNVYGPPGSGKHFLKSLLNNIILEAE